MKYVGPIILSLLMTIGTISAQQRLSKNSGGKAEIQDRILERQLTYAAAVEKRGDIHSAYLAYSQLIKKHDRDRRVVSGYVDLSIKDNKIKDCEVTLKNIVKKYPVQAEVSGEDKSQDIFPIEILGYVAELYLRTERGAAGQEVLSVIDSSGYPKKTRSEIRAEVYMRSGLFRDAEKIFRMLRKEVKNENSYAYELFMINYQLGNAEKFAEELIRAAVSDAGKDKRSMIESSFNPRAELFRLFESDQFKDYILHAAEVMYDSGSNEAGSILSELYFSAGDYDKAYEVLKSTGKKGSSNSLVKEFAVKLYTEKQYERSSHFFRLYYGSLGENTTEDVFLLYISSLIQSSKYAEAEKIIMESRPENSELMLADLYHNRLNRSDDALKLYEKYLRSEKAQSQYWRDYLMLLIAKGDYQAAKRSVIKVFEENIADVFDPTEFTEFKFLEAVIYLNLRDRQKFAELSDFLIKDNFPSDRDNDLLKIRKDISVIGDDDGFMGEYLKILIKSMDNSAETGKLKFDYEKEENRQKKLLLIECRFKYLELNGENEELLELAEIMAGPELIDNNFARLITGYAKRSGHTAEIKNVLLSILKSGAGEEIKAEIRELIREREPS